MLFATRFWSPRFWFRTLKIAAKCLDTCSVVEREIPGQSKAFLSLNRNNNNNSNNSNSNNSNEEKGEEEGQKGRWKSNLIRKVTNSVIWPTLELFLSTRLYFQRQSQLPHRVTWLFFHGPLEFQKEKTSGVTLPSPATSGWSRGLTDGAVWRITAGSDVNVAPMIRKGKDFFYKRGFAAAISKLLGHRPRFHLPPAPASLPLQTKGTVLWPFFVVPWAALVGQRSSCSDLVFSRKCALCCSSLLRDNTAWAGEFSTATNKTQARLCQATSDYLNKCQRRNQTLELSASDPQDKGPIDFPH